ncbi:MAG: DMT family transporter [Clostridia bacterium]|nr:DMT family transporter [Clostridia bacterium]
MKIYKHRLALIVAMTIFGTIGIFRRYIPLPSGAVALVRAVVGALLLLAFLLVKRQKPSARAIRRNLLLLLVSGIFLGFNWVLLFEAYKYTSVAVATLSYYMAPILLILAAPLLLGEKLTLKKGICAAVALLGMVLVSGVLDTGVRSAAELRGIAMGLFAAVLYAAIVLMNKKMTQIDAVDKTVVQFAVSALVLLPYVLLAEEVTLAALAPVSVLLLLVIGIVHTGVAYLLYFGAVGKLRAGTVALFSYIDPVLAVLLSALVLKEPMTLLCGVGACLVLGAAYVGEK